MENADPNITRVQHVAKSSSDQLLRKFAVVGPDKNDKFAAKDLRLAKRVKRKVCAGHGSSLPEKKSLLGPLNVHKSAALFRRLGMSKAKIRAREIKNKSIITALEKTWRRTVEGASRVLMENHYNRHKRLINDSY
ncbi:Unknown protein [Striga hermonthica]|uniref:Uncharacterized protein n=1 Tax=Striga hermonthica TaxID=68872 RepID=A0A9N7NT55_STRHE|nr:Unknown protein [Striga hermonthica]